MGQCIHLFREALIRKQQLNFGLIKSHQQVVLSQSSGSNRAGFNIVPSNSKEPINLDGIFNIISYDIVPKLKDKLLASDFKVIARNPVLCLLHWCTSSLLYD